MALEMLCYAQSKCSNIVQRINIQFIFANNVFKQFVESLHRIGLFVLYESFCYDLQTNAKAVIEEILEKI